MVKHAPKIVKCQTRQYQLGIKKGHLFSPSAPDDVINILLVCRCFNTILRQEPGHPDLKQKSCPPKESFASFWI